MINARQPSPGQSMPQRQLDVPAAFQELGNALDSPDKTCEVMCTRLHSATRQVPPSMSSDAGPKEVGTCELADQLRAAAARVRMLTGRLDGQIELLEI